MSSDSVFASIHPAIAVVWLVVMCVSIGFIILARAKHRRNVQERLATTARHLVRDAVEMREDRG
jgi:hypothetical protein